MNAHRTIALVTWAILTAGVSIIPGFLSGAVAPLVREEFELSEVAVGVSFSGFWLIGTLTAAPFARLTRRIGTLNALRLATVVIIFTSAAAGLLAWNEASFVVLVSICGFGPALAVPAANIIIMAAVPPRHQAFALTAASAGPAIGLLGAGFLVSSLAARAGWEAMFWLAALAGVALFIAGIRARREGPLDPLRTKAHRTPLTRRGPLLLALGAVLLTNIAIGGATIFIVASAPSSGVSIEHAALVTALASAASIPVRVMIGLVVDRTARDPWFAVAVLLALGSTGYLLLSSGGTTAFFAGIALILIPGWVWVNVFLYAVLARYRTDVESAVGMVQTTYFVGSVIGPIMVGALISATSYSATWLMLGIATAIGAVMLVPARRRLPPFNDGRQEQATIETP